MRRNKAISGKAETKEERLEIHGLEEFVESKRNVGNAAIEETFDCSLRFFFSNRLAVYRYGGFKERKKEKKKGTQKGVKVFFLFF